MPSRERRRPFHRSPARGSRPHVGCKDGNKRWGSTPASRAPFPWETRLEIIMRGDPIDERRLWAALTVDAVKCFERGMARERVAAAAWFASTSDAVASFLWCCDHLGLDAPVVREGLVAIRRAERVVPVVALDPPAEQARA